MLIQAKSRKCVPPAALALVLAIQPVSGRAAAPADGSSNPEAGLSFQCRYQATAYITLLSIPIFSRSGVGFGFARVEESAGDAKQNLSLRFLSGSTPERAHGLNRFGFIQENVEQRNQSTVAADYFGLMTENGEKSLEDAKAALNSAKKDMVPFVAVRAYVNQQKTSYTVKRMLLPSAFRGSNSSDLLRQVQAEFAGLQTNQGEKTELIGNRPTGTFLDSLRRAILADAPVYNGRIIFNGKSFAFRAEKRSDLKTGSALQKQHLTVTPNSVMQLAGSLRNETSGEVTTFRLWFEKGAPNFLPLRFEFKAKPYLLLVFDQEPQAAVQTAGNRELPVAVR